MNDKYAGMKGAVTDLGQSATYVTVKYHSICDVRKTDPGEPQFGVIEVTNPTTGELVRKWIKKFREIEAYVCKLEFRDTGDDFATQFLSWRFTLDAAGEIFVLEIPYGTRISQKLMMTAENIDFSKPVSFSAWHNRKDDDTAFVIRQDNIVLKQKYTKDNMGNCPPPKPPDSSVPGSKWDWSETNKYLYTQMINVVIPKVEAQGHELPAVDAHVEVVETVQPNEFGEEVVNPAMPDTTPEYMDDDSGIPF